MTVSRCLHVFVSHNWTTSVSSIETVIFFLSNQTDHRLLPEWLWPPSEVRVERSHVASCQQTSVTFSPTYTTHAPITNKKDVDWRSSFVKIPFVTPPLKSYLIWFDWVFIQPSRASWSTITSFKCLAQQQLKGQQFKEGQQSNMQ